eukprot:6126373-Ditylum_brightwellii.AAC.1
MLGDGVNQIINPKIQDEGKKLRATPHALSIPNHKEDEARAWYGKCIDYTTWLPFFNLGVATSVLSAQPLRTHIYCLAFIIDVRPYGFASH